MNFCTSVINLNTVLSGFTLHIYDCIFKEIDRYIILLYKFAL